MQEIVQQKPQKKKVDNEDDIYYSKFVNAIKSKSTKMDYTYRLKYFINFLNVKSYAELVENKDKKTIENDIINYLIYLRKHRGLSYASASQYLVTVQKFYYVNSDYEFKWKLIKSYLGDDDDDDDNSIVKLKKMSIHKKRNSNNAKDCYRYQSKNYCITYFF